MEYTDFIAVIDLGTSHIVGMVGTKNQDGVLSIIAYDAENSEACVRRGCVYNGEETANKVIRLMRKLENKLGGAKIGKLYIGVGGQSIRTIDHVVTKSLGDEGEVTPEILQQMDEECMAFKPSSASLEILEVARPSYLLDGKEEEIPLNLTCSRIEAHYKLIVGKPAIKKSILTNLADRIRIPIAGLLVSPLALADLFLSPMEKQAAVLVDFGSGVTSVTIFKEGHLVATTVIPLGSHLITRDLMRGLNVSENEAERLKRTYGSALPIDSSMDKEKIEIHRIDDIRPMSIPLSELSEIVEARAREIIENVYARLVDAGIAKDIRYSVTVSGGGSLLNHLLEAIASRFKMAVHYPSIRTEVINGASITVANNQEYATAVALLLKGKENCAYIQPKPEPVYVQPEPKPQPVPEPEPKAPESKVEEPKTPSAGEPQQEGKNNNSTKNGGGFFGNILKKVKDVTGEGDLFSGDF